MVTEKPVSMEFPWLSVTFILTLSHVKDVPVLKIESKFNPTCFISGEVLPLRWTLNVHVPNRCDTATEH